MLSEFHQKVILKMWIKQNYDNEAVIRKEELAGIYKGRSSFFRGMQYLVDSGLVEKVQLHVNAVCYRLTIRGSLLAKVLCGLPDVPEQFKADSSLAEMILKWRV